MTESQPQRLRFHIVIDREARQIAQRLKDATQLRVFLLLPSFLRWEAWHPIDEERIAGELKISLTSCEKRSPHSYCTASFCTTIPITVSLSGASRLCGVRRVRGGRCRPISRAKQTGSRTRTAGERTRTRVRGGCHVAPKPRGYGPEQTWSLDHATRWRHAPGCDRAPRASQPGFRQGGARAVTGRH
jgi:hypothetical protein